MLKVSVCVLECVTPASNEKVNGSSLSMVTERPGLVIVWGAAKMEFCLVIREAIVRMTIGRIKTLRAITARKLIPRPRRALLLSQEIKTKLPRLFLVISSALPFSSVISSIMLILIKSKSETARICGIFKKFLRFFRQNHRRLKPSI